MGACFLGLPLLPLLAEEEDGAGPELSGASGGAGAGEQHLSGSLGEVRLVLAISGGGAAGGAGGGGGEWCPENMQSLGKGRFKTEWRNVLFLFALLHTYSSCQHITSPHPFTQFGVPKLFEMETNLNRERSGRTARYPGGEGVLVIVVANPNLTTTFSKFVL